MIKAWAVAYIVSLLLVIIEQRVVPFINTSKKIRCRCYSEKSGERTSETYIFSYGLAEKRIGNHRYYLAESNFFAAKEVYLRNDNHKVFIVTDMDPVERLFLDFDLGIGDTLKYHNSQYIFRSKNFDTFMKEDIYRFQLTKERGSLSHSCIVSAFEVSKQRGFVKIEYKCTDRDNYFCLMRSRRY